MAKTDLKILKGMTMVRSGGCTAHVTYVYVVVNTKVKK